MDLLTVVPPERPDAIVDTTVWSGSRWASHQDILLTDGRITDVCEHVPGRVGIDGSAMHVVPGFVNSHTHLQQSMCRGIGEGRPLLEWLHSVGGAMRDITPQTAYLAAVAGAVEGLRSGSTTLVEHMWPHRDREVHDAVLAGLRDVGVRAIFGRGVSDRADETRRWGSDPALVEPVESTLADIDRLAAAAKDDRIEMAVAVPNPRSLSVEAMADVRDFARSRDMTVMIHLLETSTDDDMCRERTGMSAVRYLAESDFLWNRLLAVHCVQASAEDLAILADHDVSISWNPVSNMRLGSGVAPVLDMLTAGIGVGVGVDGAASNDRQDMVETLRTGSYVVRASHRRADLLGFAEMIAIACDGANSALGRPTTAASPGGVVAGRPADLVAFRFTRDLACLPVHDPGATILTAGTPQAIELVLVDGEVVVRDGRSTRIDERLVVEALEKCAA